MVSVEGLITGGLGRPRTGVFNRIAEVRPEVDRAGGPGRESGAGRSAGVDRRGAPGGEQRRTTRGSARAAARAGACEVSRGSRG